ncbi:hypothetical protein [Dactylosporangium sp. CA-139066]|uniref:hypothetical protein n=1 Tax=Dactylosporangium sp. CA-139066 TaxID=3239930 RepID=UPI003D90152B
MARVEVDEEGVLEETRKLAMAWLTAKAVQAAGIAASTAPSDDGTWSQSFSVKKGRWAVWVVSSDPAAVQKELGARHGKNPKFRTMAKALEAVREA